MATLTQPQIDYIRDESGDIDGPDYVISDAKIQTIYDSPDWGNSNLDYTLYYVLRRLRAIYSPLVAATSNTLGYNNQAQQKFDHINLLLQELGARLGIGMGSLSVGVIDLNTDFDESDLYRCG